MSLPRLSGGRVPHGLYESSVLDANWGIDHPTGSTLGRDESYNRIYGQNGCERRSPASKRREEDLQSVLTPGGVFG